ncbi:MAG: protein kinase, partial [Pirellulaceae bacterium]|nr:protein kinase [Pirellulaceae bacterium]
MSDGFQEHPEKDQLAAFGLGKIDPSEAEKIAEHLESCRECSETIISLKDDTFVLLVRNSPAPASAEGDDSQQVAEPGLSPQINAILAEYLQAVEAGESPDEEKLLEQYPEFAGQLREFFADKRKIDEMAKLGADEDARLPMPTLAPNQPTTPGLDAPTLAPSSPNVGAAMKPTAGVSGKVRYFGDYELLEEIARGGMGVVYKARQINLNRTVALKMILAGQLASEDDVKRFYTEAEAAANLDHPGIVPIFEVGEHEGQHYFSMGFVEGESLADRLKDGPLPPREAAEYTKKIAEAIAFAHERGVIHRDLKPANVLLAGSGQRSAISREQEGSDSKLKADSSTLTACTPKVTDFGLAKKTESDSNLTGTGQILGTPSYMPPEQASGKVDEVTELADVYSLGAILYALVTGRPPFQADNPLDTLLQVLEREPVSPRTLNPKVPQDLETICLKCLEKDRQRRYASAQDLADELRRFLEGEPIHARPISASARAWRWCKRKPILAGLWATAVVLLLALSIGGPILAVQQKKLAEQQTAFATEQARLRSAADQARGEERTQRERANKKAAEALREKKRATKSEAEALAAAEEVRGQLYLAQVSLADRSLSTNDVRQAEEVLDTCLPRLRDWEWRYLKQLCHPELLSVSDNFYGSGLSARMALSPDGRRFTNGNRICNAVNGEDLVTLVNSPAWLYCPVFSPDGTRLAGYDGQARAVKVWDAATGKELLKFGVALSKALAFSPDGTRLATGGFGEVKIWEATTGDELLTLRGKSGPVAAATSVAYSPDGQSVATAWLNTCRIWDAASGEELLEITGEQVVWNVAFSPDGKVIALAEGTAAMYPGQVRLWFVASGRPIRTLHGHAKGVNSVAFSPDGTRIASGGNDSTVRIWNVASGREITRLLGHTSQVMYVAFSPDGSRLVSHDDQAIKIWDTRPGPRNAVALSNDGKRVVSISGGTISVSDIDTGEPLLTLNGQAGALQSAAFNSDGTRIVAGGATLRLWDATTGKEVLCFGDEELLALRSAGVRGVAFSPEGNLIASAGSKGVQVWDVTTGEEAVTLQPQLRAVYDVAFSPDGARILGGGQYGRLQLWDTRTGESIRGRFEG